MRYPKVRYRPTRWPTYLDLDCWDGTCCGVAFRDEVAAVAATAAGRAEVDCSAIAKGFLPSGATLVSRAGFSPSLDGSSEEVGAATMERAAATDNVTPERDEAARRLQPNESRIYDRLVGSMSKAASAERSAGRTIH